MGNPQVKVTVEVVASSVEEAFAALEVGARQAIEEKAVADKPKTRRTKTKPAPEPQPEPEPAPEPQPEPEAQPEVEKKDVEVALRSFIRNGKEDGVKKASAILKKFNATTIHNLDPTSYAAVLDMLGEAS